MKQFLFLILLVISVQSFSQIDVKTYYENIENGYIFYADNNEPVPVSIKVDFELKNLKSSEGNNKIFLLPANTKKINLTTLTTIKNGKYNVSGNTRYNYGDHYQIKYDKEFPYNLPYNKGETFLISQGYNGKISHANENAIDFSMPVGTPILASRDGVVVEVIDVFNKHCPTRDCEKYNNKIIVYHSDGTFAEYTHIKRKSSKVKKGDKIEVGQIIAESGNVGWSTGPHLHLVFYIQTLDGRKTLETKFKINDGSDLEILTEKERYTRNYD